MKEDGAFYQDFENAERIGYLIASYILGTLTPFERKELDEWILSSEKNELLFDELTSQENIEKTMQWYKSIDHGKARTRIAKRISFATEKRKAAPFSFIAIAASVLLVIGIAAFYFFTKKELAPIAENSTVAAADILPGSNKAILILVSGKQIVLDSTAPKTIEEGKIMIDNGRIRYEQTNRDEASQNQLIVPRGGQYRLVLSDGTNVWLNAASSLSYPTVFTGSERRVALSGEAYFEVTKNREKPFIVQSSQNTIKVLGTKFNVNSYGDEDVFKTTLVDGSVLLTHGTSSTRLKPGEEGRIKQNSINVVQVDTREATAWKDGEFLFRNAPVHSIVSQLARWYDLEVEYRDPVDKHLNATIPRNVPLSKVLHYLEKTGEVHFRTEGKKLIVMT